MGCSSLDPPFRTPSPSVSFFVSEPGVFLPSRYTFELFQVSVLQLATTGNATSCRYFCTLRGLGVALECGGTEESKPVLVFSFPSPRHGPIARRFSPVLVQDGPFSRALLSQQSGFPGRRGRNLPQKL